MRYYLIPLELDPAKRPSGCEVAPKYLDLIGTCWGIPPANAAKGPYYIVLVPNEANVTQLEKQADVVKLDATFDKTKLAAVGVDTSKIGVSPTQTAIEGALTKWLTGAERDLDSFNHPSYAKWDN